MVFCAIMLRRLGSLLWCALQCRCSVQPCYRIFRKCPGTAAGASILTSHVRMISRPATCGKDEVPASSVKSHYAGRTRSLHHTGSTAEGRGDLHSRGEPRFNYRSLNSSVPKRHLSVRGTVLRLRLILLLAHTYSRMSLHRSWGQAFVRYVRVRGGFSVSGAASLVWVSCGKVKAGLPAKEDICVFGLVPDGSANMFGTLLCVQACRLCLPAPDRDDTAAGLVGSSERELAADASECFIAYLYQSVCPCRCVCVCARGVG